MENDTKKCLRIDMIKTRKELLRTQQLVASHAVCQILENLPLYQNAPSIALYHAVGGEIDLSLLWTKAIQAGKICFFPSINPDFSLSFVAATPESHFKKNRFGILEPIHGARANAFELVLVPLVAFDLQGTRVGMGAGYYDRTLKNIDATFVGVGYDFQKVAYIEPEPWDIPLDAVVTEKTMYWMNK